MEIIKLNSFSMRRLHRQTLGLGIGLALIVGANLGDRAFSAGAANAGIDPLAILDTSVKNNILFIVDTSGSMAGTPEDQNRIVGGDDPASRFYQVKRAVRDVITANVGKANFGLSTFHPQFIEHEIDGSQGLVYVTQDPSASVWRNYFQAVSNTFTAYDTEFCAAACTATEKTEIFQGLESNSSASASAYPAGCLAQPGGDQVSSAGVTNPPITHTYGTHCRDYVKSRLMRNGRRYRVTPGLGAGAARTNGALVSTTNIVCPPPPPGLVGDDVLAFADGSQARACMQIQNATTNAITTYWVTGTNFDFVDAVPPLGSQCAQSGINVEVADCGVDVSDQIKSYMRMELQYNAAAGAPRDVPALTNLTARKPNLLEAPPFSLDVTPPITPPFLNPGIRQGNGTPLDASMAAALSYFRTTVLPIAGTLKRPANAIGKQKQFVIMLTDGDESCGGNPNNAAYNLWNNTSPALPPYGPAQTAAGISAADWAAANRIELFMITFAGGTPANVNAISQAGSGRNPANGVCQPGGACRNSIIANNLTDLINALNDAINQSTATGEFSDQQSITESVYEYANLGTPPPFPSPLPNPTPTPFPPLDPLSAETRYFGPVPILLQSTFELPDYKGHLRAFRRGSSATSVLMWDAGQKLYDRVLDPTLGMGAAPATPCTIAGVGCYEFSTLYGNATLANVKTSTAKIKRRVFTTTQNGVNPGYTVANLLNPASGNLDWTRIPLWPPTTGAASNTFVAPTATFAAGLGVKGILDTAFGLDALTTVLQVQTAVSGACQGSVAGSIHLDCTSVTAGLALARTKREAREITLAYVAGARLQVANGIPVRSTATRELLYVVRPWVMVESTLAAPGVVTPPPPDGIVDTSEESTVPAGVIGVPEYKAYRDGLKTSAGAPINHLADGLGLRHPDLAGAGATAAISNIAKNDVALKPNMSVVYHATNQGLHAFRAGPCPVAAAGSGLFGTTLPCNGETGGEELWAFVPYDVLQKLPVVVKPQSRSNKQYLLASPARFSDVFVPAPSNIVLDGTTFSGVWRTLLYFGRGAGGKSYTALDVTTPGPFTNHSLQATPPVVVWSRGNPDTTFGIPTGSGGVQNGTASDYAAYLKMGETWSVPSVGFVNAADYGGTPFVLFTGSGYSDVATEGKTFYVLNALTGSVARSFDIPSGTPAPPNGPPLAVPADPPLTNFLVASPVAYVENHEGQSPAGATFGRTSTGGTRRANTLGAKAKVVYFGDLHGRLWRYNPLTPANPPTMFFAVDTAAAGNQPFATAVSDIQEPPPGSAPSPPPPLSTPGRVLVYIESGHDRRVTPNPAKPFKAYAFRDDNGVRTTIFERSFDANFRGTVQPATGFSGTPLVGPFAPIVFFAGTRFNAACVGTFDSVLIALKGLTTLPGIPEAAFDLKATGDDSQIVITDSKIGSISVSSEGHLIIDEGLRAQNLPQPPGAPLSSTQTGPATGGGGSTVYSGLVPGTDQYKELANTTVPFRVGSSVCRTEYK